LADESHGRTQVSHALSRYQREHTYPQPDIIRIETSLQLIGSGYNVLDVGAFEGQISAAIASLGNTVTAMDVSPQAVAIAAARGVSTVVADLSSTWPLPDEIFDVVFAGEIIEHLIDTDFFLGEARRVLRKSGRLIITTPNLASLARRIMLLLGKNPYIDTALRPDQAGHVRYFVLESLTRLLSENHFKVTRSRGDVIVYSGSGRGLRPRLPGLARFCKSLIIEAVSI
jgi:2-polyprenyl-3-methyl-5-hydroxy-6-metoxy-1,4-benzoquinol methylase